MHDHYERLMEAQEKALAYPRARILSSGLWVYHARIL